MGTTLGSGSGLDQDKTLACRTLRTSPRHAWRTVPSTATTTHPLELPGRQRDLRKAKDDAQDDCHARRHTPQCTFYSARPLHPRDLGKKTTTSPFSCTCTPPLLVSIKGGGGHCPLHRIWTILRTQRNSQEHTRSSESRYWHSPQSTPPLAETWELSSLSRLACTPYYRHLGARQYNALTHPFAGRTAPRPEPG